MKTVSEGSRLFYRYKLYQLDALLNLGRFQQLEEVLRPWLNDESAPLVFRLAVVTYKAKSLYVADRPEQANAWLSRAVSLMSEINQQLSSPMAMIEIANLQLYLGQTEIAYQTLRNIEERHSRHASPTFRLELYANLAQAVRKQGKLGPHLSYRQQSLFWARKSGNNQQIAVSWHNVARAYQFLQQYDEAEQAFIAASDYAKLASDTSTLMQCLLYRAQIAHHKAQEDKARQLLELIDKDQLTPRRRLLFKRLLSL
jgi:tetratricopeptide (TPR) repeat protein